MTYYPVSDPSGVIHYQTNIFYDGQERSFLIGDEDGFCDPYDVFIRLGPCECGLELTDAEFSDDIPNCPDETWDVTISYRTGVPAGISLDNGATLIPGIVLPVTGGAVEMITIGLPYGESDIVLQSLDDPTCIDGDLHARKDPEPPTPVCRGLTVTLDESETAEITGEDLIDQTAPDFCDSWIIEADPLILGCSDIGRGRTVEVMVSAIYPEETLVATCIASVVVEEPPISLPDCKSVTLQLDENGIAEISGEELIEDVGELPPCYSFEVTPASLIFDCDDANVSQTVTVSMYASHPNKTYAANCLASVSVEDNLPPEITCHDPIVYFNGEETITLDPSDVFTAFDNCEIASFNMDPPMVSCEQIGEVIPVTVTVVDASNNEASCTANVTVGGLPCGFSTCPGHVDCADSFANFDPTDQTFHLTGVNCFYVSPYNSDELAYIRHEFCGNGEIIAKLESVGGTTFGWAGISLRENCDPGSKKFEIIHNGSNLIRREARTTTGGYAFPQQYPIFNRRWFKLVRQGNQVIAYISPNGVNWQFIGAKTIVMPYCIEAGLAVTNYQPVSQVTGVFSNVSIISDGTGCPACLTTEESVDLAAMDLVNANQDVETEQAFNAFPNPTTDQVFVAFAHENVNGTLEVFDQLGQKVQSFEIGQSTEKVMELSLENLPKGVYFIKLQEKNGQLFTERLILN